MAEQYTVPAHAEGCYPQQWWRRRKARKDYACNRCRREIEPGSHYWVSAAVEDRFGFSRAKAKMTNRRYCDGCGGELLGSYESKPSSRPQPPPEPPAWCVDGASIWYHPIIGDPTRWAGVVDGAPRLLGGHTLVVELCEMDPAYAWAAARGGRVFAASLDALELRKEADRG